MKKIICAILSLGILVILVPSKPVYAYDNGIVSADLKTIEVNLNDEVKPSDSMVEIADNLGMDVRTFVTQTSIPIIATRTSNIDTITLNSIQTETYFIPKEYNIQPYASGTLTDTTTIVASAADVKVTIYYDTYNSNNFRYGKLTKTSGSVSDFKSGFKFSRVDATLGSNGLTATQTTKKTSTANPWTFNAPTNWQYNQMGNGFCTIGAKCTVYITRDGNTLYNGSLNVQVN